MKSCINKIFLCFLILNTCCFHFTSQQFGFNDFGFGFPRSFYNPNSEAIQSDLKIDKWLPPGQELVFSRGGNNPGNAGVGAVANDPLRPTMTPLIPAATTPSPQFLQCFQRCPTTSEYNPICASNRELYGNEQKFNCARRCGAVLVLCLLGVSGISALARADSWPHQRPNNTYGQAQNGYKPATGYQPNAGYQPNNGYQPNHGYQPNNGYQPNAGYQPNSGYQPNAGYQPNNANRNNTGYQPNSGYQPNTGYQPNNGYQSNTGYTTQRPQWNRFNQTQGNNGNNYNNRPMNNTGGQNYYPQTYTTVRPGLNNNSQYNPQPQQNGYGYTADQTRPGVVQPGNNNPYSPSAPSNSHIYPILPNSGYTNPTNPNQQGGAQLAPLQPQPQGPNNWHSGGTAALSYPGHNPQTAAGNSNYPQAANQGNKNPYAPMYN